MEGLGGLGLAWLLLVPLAPTCLAPPGPSEPNWRRPTRPNLLGPPGPGRPGPGRQEDPGRTDDEDRERGETGGHKRGSQVTIGRVVLKWCRSLEQGVLKMGVQVVTSMVVSITAVVTVEYS